MRIRRAAANQNPPAGVVAHSFYRQLLQEKRSAIVAALGTRAGAFARADRVPEEDQAQHSHDEFVSLRLNGMEYDQLRQVEDALDRIHAGEYGVCQSCGETIPENRLRVIPWAKYCVRCQERKGDSVYRETPRFVLQDESAW